VAASVTVSPSRATPTELTPVAIRGPGAGVGTGTWACAAGAPRHRATRPITAARARIAANVRQIVVPENEPISFLRVMRAPPGAHRIACIHRKERMKRLAPHRPALLAGTALAAACALAACGSDDKSSDSSKPRSVALTVSQSGKKYTIDAPSTVKGGLAKVTLKNTVKGAADAQLVRVVGNHSEAEMLDIVASDKEGAPTPEWIRGAGGPAAVKTGTTGSSTVVLTPGTYYAIDDQDAPGGKTAARLGAVAKITVKGGDDKAKLPSAPATIDAREYSFSTSGLKAGANTVAFQNRGKELHHAQLFPLAKGADLNGVRKFLSSQGKSGGPPPIDFNAGTGTTVLDGGDSEVTRLNLKKGNYALLCFVSDRKGGPPHFMKGMLDEVTVK
jgi:hypothetical protein